MGRAAIASILITAMQIWFLSACGKSEKSADLEFIVDGYCSHLAAELQAAEEQLEKGILPDELAGGTTSLLQRAIGFCQTVRVADQSVSDDWGAEATRQIIKMNKLLPTPPKAEAVSPAKLAQIKDPLSQLRKLLEQANEQPLR